VVRICTPRQAARRLVRWGDAVQVRALFNSLRKPTKALWTLHGPDSNAACGDAVQRRRRDTRLRAASNDVRADSNMALDWVLA
jgi:hypothetical protein